MHHEVKVTVRFVGDNVEPEMLTSKLGIQPSKTHVKGELSTGRSSHAYPTGYWGIDSPYSSDQGFEEHLEYLLDILEPKLPILKQLEEMGLSPNFYCGFFAAEKDSDIYIRLDPTILERLGRLGASLDFHIYDCVEEEM